jgi:putative transposase
MFWVGRLDRPAGPGRKANRNSAAAEVALAAPPSQYLSIRYTERLAEEGAVTSVGSRGDSYDNALAESVNSLYKGELIRRRGPWRTADDVELATLAWVDWWNNRRIHGATGGVPPAEFEAEYYRRANHNPRSLDPIT